MKIGRREACLKGLRYILSIILSIISPKFVFGKNKKKEIEIETYIPPNIIIYPTNTRYRIIEPQDSFHKKLIRNWELAYLGRYELLANENITGYTTEGLMKQNLFGELIEGFRRSGEYYNNIKLIFVEYDLPVELVDVAFNESHWKYEARSPANAEGIFQFMEPTAKYYGLKTSKFIDERYDPLLSAEACAKYLKDLYNRYKDIQDSWFWALAAYNQGEERLKKYYEQCNSYKFFSDYIKLLREEHDQLKFSIKALTAVDKNDKDIDNWVSSFKNQKKSVLEKMNYVAKFFGIRRALYNPGGISKFTKRLKELEFDSVKIDYIDDTTPLITLKSLCEKLNIKKDEILYLNKAIRLPKESKDFDLNQIILPQGYNLRLYPDLSEKFISKFKNILKDTNITKFRKGKIILKH